MHTGHSVSVAASCCSYVNWDDVVLGIQNAVNLQCQRLECLGLLIKVAVAVIDAFDTVPETPVGLTLARPSVSGHRRRNRGRIPLGLSILRCMGLFPCYCNSHGIAVARVTSVIC